METDQQTAARLAAAEASIVSLRALVEALGAAHAAQPDAFGNLARAVASLERDAATDVSESRWRDRSADGSGGGAAQPPVDPSAGQPPPSDGQEIYGLRRATAADAAADSSVVVGQWLLSRRVFQCGEELSFEPTVPHLCPVVEV